MVRRFDLSASGGIVRAAQSIMVENEFVVGGDQITLKILGGFAKTLSSFNVTFSKHSTNTNTSTNVPVLVGRSYIDESGESIDLPNHLVVEPDASHATVFRAIECDIQIPQDANGFYDVSLSFTDADGNSVSNLMFEKSILVGSVGLVIDRNHDGTIDVDTDGMSNIHLDVEEPYFHQVDGIISVGYGGENKYKFGERFEVAIIAGTL